jgi:hypothetical protein
MRSDNLLALQRALEDGGVMFLDPGNVRTGGEGVRRRAVITASVRLCIAVIICALGRADAQVPYQFWLLSEGSATCWEFNTQSEMQRLRMEWIAGWISGLNNGVGWAGRPEQAMAGRSSSTGFATFDLEWVRNYCAAHPTDVLAKAGTMLRLDFIRRETGR